MNQTTKIILAVLITAIVVGRGVYYWQTQNLTPFEIPATEEVAPTATDEETNPIVGVNEEPSIVNNWQVYTNSEFGFRISYPQDWVYSESSFIDRTSYAVYFGTPESRQGGYIWGISFHQPSELEKIISQTGSQFEDRKESRSEVMVNKNITGTMVTVTTNKYTGWISKKVYFENNGQLFAIGNGAIDDDTFETFYKSFEFAN